MLGKIALDAVASLNLIAALVTLFFCCQIIYKHLLQ